MASTGSQNAGEKASPGPAAYDVRELNKSKISFTFRPRTTAGTESYIYHLNSFF